MGSALARSESGRGVAIEEFKDNRVIEAAPVASLRADAYTRGVRVVVMNCWRPARETGRLMTPLVAEPPALSVSSTYGDIRIARTRCIKAT